MNHTYYAMKRRLGGEKWTVRDKLCYTWYPCPGCSGHEEIVGKRRAEILFKRYSGRYTRPGQRGHNLHKLYWRTHPTEWAEIQRQVGRNK